MKNDKNTDPNGFAEGDIFYTFYNEEYHLFKLLKSEPELGTYHVLMFKPIDSLPAVEDINKLDVMIYHAPIASDGFEHPTLFAKSTVADYELTGYYEYLRQTGNFDLLAKIAGDYYREAYYLTDHKQYETAIEKYTKAIELIPNFFEAVDNRAFCKMDMGLWADAIEDFKLSLTINPNSFLAEFSIGECLLHLKDYENAALRFEKASEIDSTQQVAKDFLKKARDLAG